MLLRFGLFVAVVILVLTVFAPRFGGFFTRLTSSSETVMVPETAGAGEGVVQDPGQELEIVTLLGFDAIPAILDPSFVTAEQADDWMEPGEPVLGVSINGEHRAYSVRMLSRHEIVNDIVGGIPVAVTW